RTRRRGAQGGRARPRTRGGRAPEVIGEPGARERATLCADVEHDIEQLTVSAVQIERGIGLELQWDLREDGDGLCHWMLALHVIVEKPGRDHSRYATVELAQFEGEELDQRRVAHLIASAVGEATGLRLYAPPVEDRGGQGESA